MKLRRSKLEERANKLLFSELPYFNFRGNLAFYHGQFNNSIPADWRPRRNLDKLNSLYDLDIFSLNSNLDTYLNTDFNLPNQRIQSRYFSPHSFKMFKQKLSENTIKSSFSIFHNNIVSINRNLENVELLLDELDFHFDVIGISETKITNSNESKAHLNISGYTFEHVPTPLASGGIGLFVNQSMNYNVLEKTSNEAFQALWVEISFVDHKNIVCGIIYRQHNSPDDFLTYFDRTIEKMVSNDRDVYIMGDFNIDLLKCETSQLSQDFLLSLRSCYLIPTVDKPTRVYRTSATLIDNIFINNPDKLLASGNIISDISDHFSQFCITTSTKDKFRQVKNVKLRDYSRFSVDRCNDELSEIDWGQIIANGANCVNKLFSSFYNKYNAIVNKHAPMKNLSKRKAKQLYIPWITSGIRAAIKVKNKLYASGDEVRYKQYRNKINTLIRLSKRKYYNTFFENNVANMKKTWQGINELLHRRKQNLKVISALKDFNNCNKIVREGSRIPNIINEHFATVGNRLTKKLPIPQNHYLDYVDKGKSPISSFFFQPVSPEELRSEILLVPNDKSYGLYSSPTKLLKCSSAYIAPVLTEILNTSIKLGTYPSKLKMAKITPVFKGDDDTDANNYRPISLLSNFNRVFEKIIYKRLTSYIEKHDLLNSSQYGFRKGHSTQHAILDIVNDIQSNMNRRLLSCGIFIDLKKAFDTVDHDVLLDKLNHYGFRGIINSWFSSYLKKRTQTTEVDHFISDKAVVGCGVPQGSVLGPLLFLLYVNDIHRCSNKLRFYLFADDTNILYADKTLKNLETTVNNELQNLSNWLTANKLTLNIKKSNFVIFRPYQKRLAYQPKLYMFDNEKSKYVCLESKVYIKYLGVLVDQHLSWKYHIDSVVTKISKNVGLIAKLRHSVPRPILLNIYKSLVHPYLTYGLAAWGQACKTYLNKILILQKRVLRLLYFTDWHEHAIPLFLDANVLPITFLYYESVSTLMYDINNCKAPRNMLNLFQKTSNIHSYNTRSSTSGKFFVKGSRLQIQNNSFSRLGVKLWNKIPCYVTDRPKKTFKRVIRKLLFDILEREDDYIQIPMIIQNIGT